MKKLTALTVAALSLLTLSGYSKAQSVGVQFPPYYSQPYDNLNGSHYGPQNYSAGAVPQINWNVANAATGGGDGAITGSVTNANLIYNYPTQNTSTGSTLLETSTSATPISSITFALNGATTERGTGGNSFVNGTGDQQLASGGAFNTSGGVSLTLGGLNATDNYTLIVYISTDYYFYTNQTVAVSLGSATNYLYENSTLGSWTQATSTDSTNPTLANYASFTLSGAALEADTLTVNNVTGSAGGSGLSGFQLIDNGGAAVPEPSTIGLFAIGFLALSFQLCRNRFSRI